MVSTNQGPLVTKLENFMMHTLKTWHSSHSRRRLSPTCSYEASGFPMAVRPSINNSRQNWISKSIGGEKSPEASALAAASNYH
jgi:hypothetical protein